MTVVVRGTGSIGMRHLRVLRDVLGVQTVAWPIRAERRAELERAGFAVWTDAMEFPGVHAGIIATDTARHLSDLGALAPFMDVLVEKPLAATVEGLREVADQLALGGHRAWVGFGLRFDPSLNAARASLTALGVPHAVRIECQSYLPDWRPGTDFRAGYAARAEEGGVLRDLSHELDYAVWLFGLPAAVTATLQNQGRLGISSDESADLCWSLPQGTVVTLRLDYLTRVPRRRMVVAASEGTLTWDGIAQTVLVERPGRAPDLQAFTMTRDMMMAEQLRAYLTAASGGAEDPRLASFAQGATIVALADAARRSSLGGRSEPVMEWSTVR